MNYDPFTEWRGNNPPYWTTDRPDVMERHRALVAATEQLKRDLDHSADAGDKTQSPR